MRRIGVHTSIAGGLPESLKRAKRLGCNTLQIFSHNPRGWAVRDIPQEEIRKFVEIKNAYGLFPVFIHTSYLINLASAKRDLRKKSVDMVAYELEMADKIEAEYVVLHTGSASGDDPGTARRRVIDSLREISGRGLWKAGLLLENTSGHRGDVTSRISEIAEIIEAVSDDLVSGICLDTCHAFSGGYNIRTANGIEAMSGEINQHLERNRVKLLHVNDAKGPLGSGLDRHAHIGEGLIGSKGIKRILLHPRFDEIPIILETPKKSDTDDIKNLRRIRNLLASV